MYYGITLVVSFHPIFITKVDQAFHVKCFFEEASKGLTAELGVSMIPTTELEARHSVPGCTYSIHRSSIEELDAGKPAGTAIQFAKVGDKVLHQWHCDDGRSLKRQHHGVGNILRYLFQICSAFYSKTVM